MTEIRFYHLQKQTLDQALPLILEKVFDAKKKAVVRLTDNKEVARMNDILWTHKPHSFLPHGSIKNGYSELQPIWLTDKSENPNQADTLILTQGCIEEDLSPYNLCCEILDGLNGTAIQHARQRWKKYKDQGFEVTYWYQNENGRWDKKA